MHETYLYKTSRRKPQKLGNQVGYFGSREKHVHNSESGKRHVHSQRVAIEASNLRLPSQSYRKVHVSFSDQGAMDFRLRAKNP